MENARTFSWGRTGESGNIGRWPVGESVEGLEVIGKRNWGELNQVQ